MKTPGCALQRPLLKGQCCRQRQAAAPCQPCSRHSSGSTIGIWPRCRQAPPVRRSSTLCAVPTRRKAVQRAFPPTAPAYPVSASAPLSSSRCWWCCCCSCSFCCFCHCCHCCKLPAASLSPSLSPACSLSVSLAPSQPTTTTSTTPAPIHTRRPLQVWACIERCGS